MKMRAASIGGAFGFVSAPGRGTAVEVVLRV
jgi:signal transduction histidine kinase